MSSIEVKASKPIEELKKGDKIKVDSLNLEIDTQFVMIEHNQKTKEMAIECFDPKTDKDYQIRYFSHLPKESIEFYELKDIIYSKVEIKKIEW